MQRARIFKNKGGYAMGEDRFERGRKPLKALNADGEDQVLEFLADIATHMGRLMAEFAYNDIYARPALDSKSKESVGTLFHSFTFPKLRPTSCPYVTNTVSNPAGARTKTKLRFSGRQP